MEKVGISTLPKVKKTNYLKLTGPQVRPPGDHVRWQYQIHQQPVTVPNPFCFCPMTPERNEDKENKTGLDLKKPKESVEQNMGGRINYGTTRS